MERFFQILAVILAGVAAYFLWLGNADRAFVAAVFGAVSFFLSVRVQVKRRLTAREKEEEEKWRRGEEETEEEFDEEGELSDSDAPRLNEMAAEEQIDKGQRKTDKEQI